MTKDKVIQMGGGEIMDEKNKAKGTVLGENLKRLVQAKGMTYSELANRSTLSVSGISDLMNGRFNPSFETVAKIGLGLGLSFEDFQKHVLDGFEQVIPIKGIEVDPTLPIDEDEEETGSSRNLRKYIQRSNKMQYAAKAEEIYEKLKEDLKCEIEGFRLIPVSTIKTQDPAMDLMGIPKHAEVEFQNTTLSDIKEGKVGFDNGGIHVIKLLKEGNIVRRVWKTESGNFVLIPYNKKTMYEIKEVRPEDIKVLGRVIGWKVNNNR